MRHSARHSAFLVRIPQGRDLESFTELLIKRSLRSGDLVFWLWRCCRWRCCWCCCSSRRSVNTVNVVSALYRRYRRWRGGRRGAERFLLIGQKRRQRDRHQGTVQAGCRRLAIILIISEGRHAYYACALVGPLDVPGIAGTAAAAAGTAGTAKNITEDDRAKDAYDFPDNSVDLWFDSLENNRS